MPRLPRHPATAIVTVALAIAALPLAPATAGALSLSSGTLSPSTLTSSTQTATSGATSTTSSASTLLVPVNTALPSISGTPQPGNTLTCLPGTWTNSPTSFVYAWQANGGGITGQSSNTYQPTQSDVGTSLTCSVTAANLAGLSLPATSLPVTITALPSTTTVTSPLPLPSTTTVTSPLPTTTTLTGSTTGTSPTSSSSTTTVPLLPVNTTLPSLSGTPQPGSSLTCLPGGWSNTPTGFTYSWQSNGSAIPGQSTDTYQPSQGDVGNSLTCTVTAINLAGASLPAISLPVAVTAATSGLSSPPMPSGSPTSSGSTQPAGSQTTTPATPVAPTTRPGTANPPGTGPSRAHVPAPRLSRLQVTPGQIVVSRHGRQISLSTIRFAFRASVASFGALIAIEQAVPGARTTKGCVPRAGHVLKRCTTYRLLTLLSDKRVRAGSNTYRFSGKIGSKPLPAGSYSVVVIAANLGGWSNELTHGFKVVSAKPHPARPARPRHARNPARQPPRKPASRKTAHAKPRH